MRNRSPKSSGYKHVIIGLPLLLFFFLFSNTLAFGVSENQSCTKVGQKSGNFVCAKAGGKIQWKPIKVSQKIATSIPKNLTLSIDPTELSVISTAGLPVSATSLSPSTCTVNGLTLQGLKIGLCSLRFTQKGDSKTLAAKNVETKITIQGDNQIVLNLVEKYYLSDRSIKTNASSSSRLKVTSSSQTPSICISTGEQILFIQKGKCVVKFSQPGDLFYAPAIDVFSEFNIVGPNVIEGKPENQYRKSSQKVILPIRATSGLQVSSNSNSQDVCTTNGNLEVMLIKAGRCVLSFDQGGGEFIDKANTLEVAFNVIDVNRIDLTLPLSLALAIKSYQLSGIALSGLPIIYESQTPNTCSVSGTILSLLNIGKCDVKASQGASEFYDAANPIVVSTNIASFRASIDQPDILTGFQIKPIYVLPSDSPDRFLDQNGDIAAYLTEGREYMRQQLGRTVQVDLNSSGYDILFFKSRFTRSELIGMSNNASTVLQEIGLLNNPGPNRKEFMLFIDVPYFDDGTVYCGRAQRPGLTAVVAVGLGGTPGGGSCNGSSRNLKFYATHIWVHEFFHNLGVEHTEDATCDLMRGSGGCSSDWTIDKERIRYVNSNSQGVDIMTLRIWEGTLDNLSYKSNCLLPYNRIARSDGQRYAYCGIGSQQVGALQSCWLNIRTVELQQFVGNSWVTLGMGGVSSSPWGPNVSWECNNYSAATKVITVTTPGVQRYRWVVNSSSIEEFTIIWVR